jgi:hypothetical protein
MDKRGLQFSIKQLFLFTACLAGVFAVVGWRWRTAGARSVDRLGVVIFLWSLLLLGGLWGAMIGSLRQKTWRGVFWGVICGWFVAFFCVVAICFL